MSQSDNLYTEISRTKAQWQTLLAGYWKQGIRPVIVNLGSFSDGTRYAVVDQYRNTIFYLVTDLTPTTVFGFDQTLPTFITGGHSTLSRHIVAEVIPGSPGTLPVTLPFGVKVLDAAGTNLLKVDAGGAIPVINELGVGFVVSGGNSQALVQEGTTNYLVVDALPIIDVASRLTNTFAAHITTSTTTNVVAATAYLSSVVVTVDAGGAGSTLTIQDKTTPKKVVNALSTAASSIIPTVLSFGDQGILMGGGIDIITAGAAAPTCDVWVTYLQ